MLLLPVISRYGMSGEVGKTKGFVEKKTAAWFAKINRFGMDRSNV